LSFILVALLRPLGQMSDQRFLLLTAMFGSAIAIFEFMTGGIPLALATLIALVGLDRYSDWRPLLKRELVGVGTFTSAVIACFLYKQLAVWAFWGGNPLADFAQALGPHVTGSVGTVLLETLRENLVAYHIDPHWFEANTLTRVLFAGTMLLYSSSFLAYGSHVLGAIIVTFPTAGLLYFAAGSLNCEKDGRSLECLTLGAAGTVPFLWYLVFSNHAAVHSAYMVRPLALNVGLSLIASPIFISFLGLIAIAFAGSPASHVDHGA